MYTALALSFRGPTIYERPIVVEVASFELGDSWTLAEIRESEKQFPLDVHKGGILLRPFCSCY